MLITDFFGNVPQVMVTGKLYPLPNSNSTEFNFERILIEHGILKMLIVRPRDMPKTIPLITGCIR